MNKEKKMIISFVLFLAIAFTIFSILQQGITANAIINTNDIFDETIEEFEEEYKEPLFSPQARNVLIILLTIIGITFLGAFLIYFFDKRKNETFTIKISSKQKKTQQQNNQQNTNIPQQQNNQQNTNIPQQQNNQPTSVYQNIKIKEI